MSEVTFNTDAATLNIEEHLRERYCIDHPEARVSVYRYNPVSIRLRVVDPDFAGKSRSERDDIVWSILQDLPEEIVSDISVCLLITPQEQPKSLMNLEFENPSPSLL